jgi:hypothetical protein
MAAKWMPVPERATEPERAAALERARVPARNAEG